MAAVWDVNKQRPLWVEWINALNDEEPDLTAWEENFLESLTERLSKYGADRIALSAREEAVLEKIYAEKTK